MMAYETHHPFKFCLRSSFLKARERIQNYEESNQYEMRTVLENIEEFPILNETKPLENENKSGEECPDKATYKSDHMQTQTNVLKANKSEHIKELTSENKIVAIRNDSKRSLKLNSKSPGIDQRNSNKKMQLENLHKCSKSNLSSSKSLTKNAYNRPPVWKSSHLQSSRVTRRWDMHKGQNSKFAYDLSSDELKVIENFKNPMKPLAKDELKLLTSGQRSGYLTQRYLLSPESKYNYPEATSWRIGWLQRIS